VADSQTYSSADLHAVAHVYPVAGSDSRAYVHAIPDIHAMAYVDTDTCAHRYCGTYADPHRRADTNYGPVNAHAGANGHGSANAYSYGCADTHCGSINAHAGANGYAYCCPDTHAHTHADTDTYTYADPYASVATYLHRRMGNQRVRY